MYNLIVSAGIENHGWGQISGDRVFEFTSDEIVSTYKPSGAVDFQKILAFPCILMEEGTNGETARIARLFDVQRVSGAYRFRYVIDQPVTSITNSDLYDMKTELHIDSFEFHRNHWAIKDVDLYQALYQRSQNSNPAPSVFRLSQNPVQPTLVSAMMPFSAEFAPIYDTLKGSVEDAGMTCIRADDFWLHSHVIQDIVELICTSRLVICDLTGKNSNVFYEAGIAHTLGKEVILITQAVDDVPFDLRHIRFIRYLPNREGLEGLRRAVTGRIETILNQ